MYKEAIYLIPPSDRKTIISKMDNLLTKITDTQKETKLISYDLDLWAKCEILEEALRNKLIKHKILFNKKEIKGSMESEEEEYFKK